MVAIVVRDGGGGDIGGGGRDKVRSCGGSGFGMVFCFLMFRVS